jgi:hypothetical protein
MQKTRTSAAMRWLWEMEGARRGRPVAGLEGRKVGRTYLSTRYAPNRPKLLAFGFSEEMKVEVDEKALGQVSGWLFIKVLEGSAGCWWLKVGCVVGGGWRLALWWG